MDVNQSIEQVAGILHRADLNFETRADGRAYRLPFHGGNAVFVEFEPYGGDGVRVSLTSPVLDDIEPGSPGEAIALNAVNRLNRRHRFVKFLYTDGTLLAAHDLLGEDLRGPGLVNAVHAMAAAADDVAGELEDETGGLRWADMEEIYEEAESEGSE